LNPVIAACSVALREVRSGTNDMYIDPSSTSFNKRCCSLKNSVLFLKPVGSDPDGHEYAD